jgi:hypothetical protein
MSVFRHPSFWPKYAEYGKIFRRDSRGANEYAVLDRSDDEFASAIQAFYLNEIALFGEKNNSPFASRQLEPGNVSVALIPWDNTGYLYLQVQRRREDEFVEKNVKPRTKRFFNQARFTYLSNEDIRMFFRQKVSLYSGLLYQNPETPNGYRLENYVEPRRGSIREREIAYQDISVRQANHALLADIVNAIYGAYNQQPIVDSKALSRLSQPLTLIKSDLSLAEKLQLIDAVQYLLFPLLGVITFALDYITDRPVLLHLYDEPLVGGQAASSTILTETDVTDFPVENYFGAIEALPSEEIYHDTLAGYLREDLPPETSVRLFKLIETKFSFSDKEELELIQNTHPYIKDEHWPKIIKGRFSADAKFLRLLRILPIPLRIKMLRQKLEKGGKNVATYAPYHLVAIKGETNNEGFRDLLIEAILSSRPDALDKIPAPLRVPFYEELILIDYKSRKADRSSIPRALLRFRSTEKTDTRGQLILQTLMERGEPAFFEVLNRFLATDMHDFLIREITTALEENRSNWDIEQTLKFWKSIPNKTSENFLAILKFLLRNRAKYMDLARYPSEFKAFLLEGSALLDWRNSKVEEQESIDKGDYHRPLLNALALRAQRISILLRQACIEISQPLSAENIGFASWWLMDELAYIPTDNFRKDYDELLNQYRDTVPHDVLEISNESLFLLTGGNQGGKLSLVECCQKFRVEDSGDSIREELWMAILGVWVNQKIPIPALDIDHLVEKLPDDKSNVALARTVLNRSEKQRLAILQVGAQTALRWLKQTNNRRAFYISEDQDRLFEILVSLKKPSLEFIRFMIIFDSGAYPVRGGWKEYATKIKSIYERYWKVPFHDPFVEDYIILADQLVDSPSINRDYRLVLTKMVEFKLLTQNIDGILEEKILDGLLNLADESERPGQDIQRRADRLLLQFLRQANLAELIGNLELDTVRKLRIYSHLKENKLVDSDILKTLDDAYLQRIRRPGPVQSEKSSSAIFSGYADERIEITKPKTGVRYLQDDATATEKGLGLIRKAKITFLELFLFVVLLLITIIIGLEIWIATNPRVLEKVWQAAQNILTP